MDGGDADLEERAYIRYPTKILSLTYESVPFWLPCLIVYFISHYRPTHSSVSSTRSCPNRAVLESGFLGNPELYGLGVRVSLYLTWFASTVALLFAPSLRVTIASSYAFVHIGILIALLVLLIRQSCLYIAEVHVLLQLHWAGASLVLAPAPYEGGAGRDRLFGFLALSGLPVTFWVYARAFFSSHSELLETSGGTLLMFWPSEKMGRK